MIPDDDLGLLEAARAIAAGRPVDWAAIESSTGVSDSLADLLRELKVVEHIATLHRTINEQSASVDWTSEPSSSSSAAATPSTDTLPAWGPLRLLERLGEGAFGDVYRAWDPRLDREVALKLLRRADTRANAVGSAVIDEARLLARVRHPNVVTVYGADRVDGRVGLWMEFVRGRTLESILREHGPYGAQEAALIGLDLCRALSAVHRAGLLHRDVKAQNVMREAGGRIVLMDFGTGLEAFSGRPPELAGTPLYLAPEVFDGAPASARADLYSIGVVLYHLVTLSYPVQGRTVDEIHAAHRSGRRNLLRDQRPDLPDWFVQAVERALAFDPAARFESAGAMEAALARVVTTSDAAATTDLSSTSTPGERQPRPHWPMRVAAIATIVIGAGVAMARFGPRSAHDAASGAGAPPAQPPVSGVADGSVAVRKVTLPKAYLLIGGPSGDGRSFSLSDSTGNVAVVDLATSQLQRITEDAILEGDSNQFAELSAMSPDGRSIAYGWLALDGKYELRAVDVRTKRPRVLARTSTMDYVVPFEWSRDGQWILAMLKRPDHSGRLALVSSSDGTIRPVKELGGIEPQHAGISPDGEFIVYDAPSPAPDGAPDVFIVRADGTEDRPLIVHPAADANPVWSPDGREVLFTSDRSGTMDVWSVAVTRGFAESQQPRPVHRSIGRMWLRGLTQTGSYFYSLTVGSADVYEADLESDGVRNPRTVGQSYAGTNISSIWSADGTRIAYASRRGLVRRTGGWTTLVIRDAGSQREVTAVPPMNGFQVRSWSPDGRFILLQGEDFKSRAGLYRYELDNGRLTPVIVAESPSAASDVRRGEWMPDGRVLYWNVAKGAIVARAVPDGQEEVLIDLKKNGIELVAGVGRGCRLAPDGRTVALTQILREGERVSTAITIHDLGGRLLRELVRTESPEMAMFQDWTPDGQALIFTRRSGGASVAPTLWRVSIHGGAPQPLGISMPGLRDVSVRPDGRRITFTAGFPASELWVMENFLTER